MGDVRFATVGTSEICRRFCEALAHVEGARLVACCSRDARRAREFGGPLGAREFATSPDGLAALGDVDAVYLATPNALHFPQAMRLVDAGLSVLVEKPLCANAAQARALLANAERHGVVVMEAMRNLHVPAFPAIRDAVGELGTVRQATLRFSKVTSRMARLRAGERIAVFDPRMAGGALMDLGVYCVEPAVALFGRPDAVRALGVLSRVPGSGPDDPYATVDLAGEVLLGYGDKVVGLSFGKCDDGLCPCEVAGERATLLWDNVSCPVGLRVHEHEDHGMVFRMEGESATRPLGVEAPELDMACEVRHFSAAVAGDASARELVRGMGEVSVASLEVMDEARAQMGVRFPADDEPPAA